MRPATRCRSPPRSTGRTAWLAEHQRASRRVMDALRPRPHDACRHNRPAADRLVPRDRGSSMTRISIHSGAIASMSPSNATLAMATTALPLRATLPPWTGLVVPHHVGLRRQPAQLHAPLPVLPGGAPGDPAADAPPSRARRGRRGCRCRASLSVAQHDAALDPAAGAPPAHFYPSPTTTTATATAAEAG